MQGSRLPSFSSLLKSRDVEDPVNLYVHRPLAYAFVKLIYRSSITPNQVTAFAVILGAGAAACWFWGSSWAMIAGGLLLWASGIIDGADGILARAKNMQSEFGRALDGAADAVVAVLSICAALYHLWVKHHDPMQFVLAVPSIGFSIMHLYLYDFYKESYLRATRPSSTGEGLDVSALEKHIEAMAQTHSRFTYIVMRHFYLPVIRIEHRLVGWTNPSAQRDRKKSSHSPLKAEIYRKHNLAPMRLWTLVSWAPHTYLMAICGMFDRLDVYLWLRLILMNAILLILIVWQRRATEHTVEELQARAKSPMLPSAMAHS